MSRVQSSEFNRVIDLIRSIYALGHAKGCQGSCGHTVADIIESIRRLPDPVSDLYTLTDPQIINFLERATREGILRRNNVSIDCPAFHDESSGKCSDGHVDNDATIETLYHVNQQMVEVNWSNKKFADYFNGTNVRSSGDIYNPYYTGIGRGGIGPGGACPGVGTG